MPIMCYDGAMYSSLALQYDEVFPLEDEKTAFVQEAAGLPPAAILDCGCSTGSLALALGKKGYEVKGIDLDPEMIEAARKRSWGGGLLEFSILDMRRVSEYFPLSSFDLALCLGHTLVHLRDRESVEGFLRSVAAVLRDGGRFIVQILNYEMILKTRMRELPPIDRERVSFKRWYEYEQYPDFVTFRTVLTNKETGARHEDAIPLFPLRLDSLKESLSRCGFAGFSVTEDFRGAAFSERSFSLVLKARKGA
jgi:glycine/sarcosine N-methyltransferase